METLNPTEKDIYAIANLKPKVKTLINCCECHELTPKLWHNTVICTKPECRKKHEARLRAESKARRKAGIQVRNEPEDPDVIKRLAELKIEQQGPRTESQHIRLMIEELRDCIRRLQNRFDRFESWAKLDGRY